VSTWRTKPTSGGSKIFAKRPENAAYCTIVQWSGTHMGVMETGLCRREGDYWTFEFAGRIARIRDTPGVRYIASLLRQPGAALHVRTLRGAVGIVQDTKSDRATERARLSVTKGVRGAIERLDGMHPVLAAHLRATIRRGYLCSYTPDPRHPIRWKE
jgi:hypothetical protein